MQLFTNNQDQTINLRVKADTVALENLVKTLMKEVHEGLALDSRNHQQPVFTSR